MSPHSNLLEMEKTHARCHTSAERYISGKAAAEDDLLDLFIVLYIPTLWQDKSLISIV